MCGRERNILLTCVGSGGTFRVRACESVASAVPVHPERGSDTGASGRSGEGEGDDVE